MLRLGPSAGTGALIALLTLAHVASAQDAPAPSAEALIERGISLREQQRDDEAVEVFREARALEDSARVRTQLGLALLASGEFVEAYELLRDALSSQDPWVEERRAAIEGSFASAREHVGLVEIAGGEPGAEVSVNGRVVGAMPLSRPVHALAGRAVVEVSLAGYHRFTSEVTVVAGQPARLRVALVRRVEEAPGGSSDDWILPVAIVGGVLVVGAVVTGVVVATLPSDSFPEVLGTAMTLEARF
jgi:hypothetical protein